MADGPEVTILLGTEGASSLDLVLSSGFRTYSSTCSTCALQSWHVGGGSLPVLGTTFWSNCFDCALFTIFWVDVC